MRKNSLPFVQIVFELREWFERINYLCSFQTNKMNQHDIDPEFVYTKTTCMAWIRAICMDDDCNKLNNVCTVWSLFCCFVLLLLFDAFVVVWCFCYRQFRCTVYVSVGNTKIIRKVWNSHHRRSIYLVCYCTYICDVCVCFCRFVIWLINLMRSAFSKAKQAFPLNSCQPISIQKQPNQTEPKRKI